MNWSSRKKIQGIIYNYTYETWLHIGTHTERGAGGGRDCAHCRERDAHTHTHARTHTHTHTHTSACREMDSAHCGANGCLERETPPPPPRHAHRRRDCVYFGPGGCCHTHTHTHTHTGREGWLCTLRTWQLSCERENSNSKTNTPGWVALGPFGPNSQLLPCYKHRSAGLYYKTDISNWLLCSSTQICRNISGIGYFMDIHAYNTRRERERESV